MVTIGLEAFTEEEQMVIAGLQAEIWSRHSGFRFPVIPQTVCSLKEIH